MLWGSELNENDQYVCEMPADKYVILSERRRLDVCEISQLYPEFLSTDEIFTIGID